MNLLSYTWIWDHLGKTGLGYFSQLSFLTCSTQQVSSFKYWKFFKCVRWKSCFDGAYRKQHTHFGECSGQLFVSFKHQFHSSNKQTFHYWAGRLKIRHFLSGDSAKVHRGSSLVCQSYWGSFQKIIIEMLENFSQPE